MSAMGSAASAYARYGFALTMAGLLSSPALSSELFVSATPKTIVNAARTVNMVGDNLPVAAKSSRRTYRRRANGSGLLFSLGRSELTNIDVANTLTGLGYSNVSGGELDAEVGVGLGYRKSLGSRFSLDGQYLFQSASSQPVTVTVPAGQELASALEISEALPKMAQGLSVVGLYHRPFTSKVSAHLGGGLFVWRGERETRIDSFKGINKARGTDPVLQLGLGYRATRSISVEGNLQRFMMPDDDVDRVSLGLVYRFR